jgi:hypothetical protein
VRGRDEEVVLEEESESDQKCVIARATLRVLELKRDKEGRRKVFFVRNNAVK